MYRKILFFFSAMVLLVAFAGCGGKEDEAKKLGFENQYEMEAAHALGWHNKAQFQLDKPGATLYYNLPVEPPSAITRFLESDQTPFSTHFWWACAYLAICALIAFVAEHIRRQKMRGLVNNKYGSIANIGAYASEASFIEKSLLASEKGEPDTLEILKTFITISRPYTENTGSWHMERGHFNAAAYNAAYAVYQQSYQQWQIGEAAFKQQEAITESQFKARNQFYSTRSYSVPRPSAPSELSFVTYTNDYGNCAANLQHPERVTSNRTIFQTQKFGPLEIDFNKYASSTFDIYKDLFKKIMSNEVAVNIDAMALGFARHDDDGVRGLISDEIVNGLMADGSRYMYKYDRNLSITSYNTSITVNSFDFPVVIIVKKISNLTYKFIICDADEPEIVIYR